MPHIPYSDGIMAWNIQKGRRYGTAFDSRVSQGRFPFSGAGQRAFRDRGAMRRQSNVQERRKLRPPTDKGVLWRVGTPETRRTDSFAFAM